MAETKKTTTSSTKKSTTTKKPSTQKKSTSTKKSTTSTKKPSTRKKSTSSSTSKTTRTKKPKAETGRIKDKSELTTLETLEAQVEGKVIRERQPLGKLFYLIFSIVFYAVAYFYINTTVYAGSDWIETAIFAFAALFIAFVLMLFNVHMLVFYFFVLPFRRLFKQAKMEAHKEIFFSVGKNKVQTTFNKYKSIFTLVLYFLFGGLLVVASVLSSIQDGDAILQIVYSAFIILIIYLVVINSWQFLFNIIPSILEKSIDAKNGYVLTLSAAVMVIYIVFIIFDITYLAEIMIFVLIIGFIALLGVNLNMIVGEINIFQNLRGRKSKAVTRVVFIVFFGFHIYVVLYASVVAYSIYNWQPDAYNFTEVHYDITVDDEIYSSGTLVEQVYDMNGDPVNQVYDMNGDPLTMGIDENGNTLTIYDEQGNMLWDFYDSSGGNLFNFTDTNGNFINNPFFYEGRLAIIDTKVERLHTYGDFLYWTVISVSTIGYGDIAPSTEYPIAQAWGGFLGIYGLTFFALSISFVSNIAMEGINSVREESRKHD
ncbi:potassium channel family protein [Candidatus Xianfuyuplasma coldseepsis]|uniref:Two pore domain potassium channel family protein n=1 Tax=Candidatus Xianfuyuplasma coldseepsis TaxID=2782163 RepID=A0A7L7KQR7_9MOLU|nr:potassium channel family protein [Xianfuyuplasma coldseepsis]QMS85161.1 two pore domain potassium channel family protein [Xianfuyuplasma coldseepsis]